VIKFVSDLRQVSSTNETDRHDITEMLLKVDTQRSASYLDLHLEIDNGGRLKTKFYDKRDDFTFPSQLPLHQ
jgi:hypothetical protein